MDEKTVVVVAPRVVTGGHPKDRRSARAVCCDFVDARDERFVFSGVSGRRAGQCALDVRVTREMVGDQRACVR